MIIYKDDLGHPEWQLILPLDADGEIGDDINNDNNLLSWSLFTDRLDYPHW